MSVPEPIDPSSADMLEHLLIVDRDVLLAEGIASAALEMGFASVETITGVEMVPRVMQGCPSAVVLVDLDMAAGRGFQLPHRVAATFPEARVVLIVDDGYNCQKAIEALVAGASGVVFRNRGMTSLLRVLDVVRRGDVAIPRQLSPALLERLRDCRGDKPGKVRLSERQVAVLELVCQGKRDQEISNALRISPATVRSHMKSIFEKIGVNNRVDATVWAGAHFFDCGPRP